MLLEISNFETVLNATLTWREGDPILAESCWRASAEKKTLAWVVGESSRVPVGKTRGFVLRHGGTNVRAVVTRTTN